LTPTTVLFELRANTQRMFIVLPVGMNYETKRLPVATFTLMGLNVLVYLISLTCQLSFGENSQDWIYQNLWLIPGTSSATAYLTSMFVHGGFFHLLGNMMFLFLFGCCAEDMIGRARFVIFYLVGGFVAEMVFIASTPDHFSSLMPMGGASGAISACMGMYLLLRAGAEIEFKYFSFFFMRANAGEFSLPAWVAITFWFLKDLFWMFLGMQSHRRGGGTAFGAHVGGFIGGLALVGVYRLVAQKKELAEEEAAEAEAELVEAPVAPTPQPAPTERKPIRLHTQPPWVAPVSAAPPTETPTIFLHEHGQQTGPFTLTAVQAMLRQAALSPDTVYWSEGMTDWQSVTDLAG
jgi:membrane associated rhomboid family serine protease